MKAIICLGGGWQQIHTVKSMLNFGFATIVVDPNASAECRCCATEFVMADIRDYDTIYQKIFRLRKRYNILDIVAINNEVGLVSEEKLREIYGLKKSNTLLKVSLSNKLGLYKWLECQYSLSPNLCVIENYKEDAENYLYSLSRSQKIVVKPADSSGSRGVFFIDSKTTIYSIKEILKNAFSNSPSHVVLIDRFLDGDEYSIELVNSIKRGVEIVCISKRHMYGTQSARAIETIPEKTKVYLSLSEFVRRFVEDAGHTEGLLHIEVILQKNGEIYVIDVGQRGGGYWVCDKLAALKSGVNLNLYSLLLRNDLGCPVLQHSNKNYMLKYIYPNEDGLVDLTSWSLIDKISLEPRPDTDNNMTDSSRCGIELYGRL